MSNPRKLTPSYLFHKQSGRARAVWTDRIGVRHQKLLPGKYESPESLAAFAKLQVESAAFPTRCGGEEFVVVLVETTQEGAVLVAERLREAVAEHQFRFEATPISLTISIGIASTTGDAAITPTALRKAADEKLYEAKRAGRNRVCS